MAHSRASLTAHTTITGSPNRRPGERMGPGGTRRRPSTSRGRLRPLLRRWPPCQWASERRTAPRPRRRYPSLAPPSGCMSPRVRSLRNCGGRWARSWESSRARPCGAWRRPSCATIPSWTGRRPQRPSLRRPPVSREPTQQLRPPCRSRSRERFALVSRADELSTLGPSPRSAVLRRGGAVLPRGPRTPRLSRKRLGQRPSARVVLGLLAATRDDCDEAQSWFAR